MAVLTVLLEITAYSWILFAAIMLIKKLVKKHSSPALQYLVWFLFIARLCIPITLDSGIHLFVIPEFGASTEQSIDTSKLNAIDSHGSDVIPIKAASMSEQAQGNQVAREHDPELSQQSAILWSNSTGTPAMKAHWGQVVMGLWLAGIAGVLSFFIVTSARMNKKIKNTIIMPSEKIMAMLEYCKRELHIKKSIAIYVIEDITTPALTVSWNPKLLFPAHMIETMKDEQALFALRHELTHFKRKDHLVSLLLRVLEAVYWFNPIVWIASQEISMDMESACDSRVVKTMKKAEKSYYASTILEMFSRDQSPQFILGMAMAGTRDVAEKRIRSIYMKGRTKSRVRFLVIALVAVLIFSCFTTACQPTPGKNLVKSKKEDTFMDRLTGNDKTEDANHSNKINFNNMFANYTKSWKETIKVKPANIEINIDADVIIPKVDKLPVYTVLFDKMEQEQIDGFLSIFGDEEYKLNSGIKLKSDYEKAILDAQQYLATELKDIEDVESREEIRQQREHGIELLREDMKNAPETIDDIIEPIFTNKYIIQEDSQPEHYADEGADNKEKEEDESAKEHYEKTNTESINIKWKMDKDNMTLRAQRSDALASNSFNFSANRQGFASSNVIENTSDIKGFKTTYDEAQSIAEEAVSLLGLDYLCMSHSAKGIDYSQNIARTGEYTDFRKLDYKDKYYVFYFTRNFGGVSETYSSNGLRFDNRYDEPWLYERLFVEVDDNGVREISWEGGGTKLGEEISSVYELISFEELMKTAAEQLSIGNITFEHGEVGENIYENLVHMNLKIDEIALGYTRVKLSDSENKYVMIPVWDFFGSHEGTEHYKDKDSNYEDEWNIYSKQYESTGNYRHSYLTINAIDGSIIDRSLGY
ncbi:MAG TPA: DUF6034 family protein [Clostridia bacterium]|nr:DUF6034 family protein [Clostridia bacterium]